MKLSFTERSRADSVPKINHLFRWPYRPVIPRVAKGPELDKETYFRDFVRPEHSGLEGIVRTIGTALIERGLPSALVAVGSSTMTDEYHDFDIRVLPQKRYARNEIKDTLFDVSRDYSPRHDWIYTTSAVVLQAPFKIELIIRDYETASNTLSFYRKHNIRFCELFDVRSK